MDTQKDKNWRVKKADKDIWSVDTELYLQEIMSMLDTGRKAVIPVSGSSMTPFLCGGRDFVLLESTKYHAVKKGDIVLFLRPTGQFILHRVYSVTKDKYKIIGDAQHIIEGPIWEEQLKAVAVRVKRKGKWLKKWSFWNWFFRWIWIRVVPFRMKIIQVYRYLKIIIKK